MSYFDTLLAKTLSGGGGGGGSLPFPYKVVHVTFTPPEDAVQSQVFADCYYDTIDKRLVSGLLFFNDTQEHTVDIYITSITDHSYEDSVHDFRWTFNGDILNFLYSYTVGGEQWLQPNIDWTNSILEGCTYDDDHGYVFIGDNDEASITLAFESIQA